MSPAVNGVYWVQFLISNIGGGGLSAAVGIVVGFLIRRWLRPVLGGQQEIKALAQTAVDQSSHAAARATAAAEQSMQAAANAGAANESASTAGDQSRQAGEAVVWLAEQLAIREAINEELKERIDRLLGTRARQLASEARTGALLIPADAGNADDPVTVTGRHRFHTATVPTHQGDRP